LFGEKTVETPTKGTFLDRIRLEIRGIGGIIETVSEFFL
jgi:hypothetical protein